MTRAWTGSPGGGRTARVLRGFTSRKRLQATEELPDQMWTVFGEFKAVRLTLIFVFKKTL